MTATAEGFDAGARGSPHKQASAVRWVPVPVLGSADVHLDAVVTTACGQEMNLGLVTGDDTRVRCPACRAGVPWGTETTEG